MGETSGRVSGYIIFGEDVEMANDKVASPKEKKPPVGNSFPETRRRAPPSRLPLTEILVSGD